MAKRRCKAKTKAGNACRGNPLKGTERCLAHSDADTCGSVGFTPEAGRLGGRPRVPRPSEIAAALVEQNVYAVYRPHFKALGLLLDDEGGISPCAPAEVVYQGELTGIEDLGAQMAASEKLQDRAHGKPRQQLEHTGEGGGPVEVDGTVELDVGDPEVRRLAHELLRRQQSS